MVGDDKAEGGGVCTQAVGAEAVGADLSEHGNAWLDEEVKNNVAV